MRVSSRKAFLSAVVVLASAVAANAQITANQFRIQDTSGVITGHAGVYTINAKNAVGFSLV